MTSTSKLPGPEWLPGLNPEEPPENRLDAQTDAGATFWVPQLDEDDAARVAEHVREAAISARRSHRTADVIGAIGAATRRLADPGDRYGGWALDAVAAASGSRAAAAEIIRQQSALWTAPRLSELVRAELGELGVLDEARPDGVVEGRRRRALGPPLMHLVLAGNVPGVAVTAVIRALIVRSGILCKLPADEPWLVGLFARALQEEDPALAATLAATWWPVDTPGPASHEWLKRSGKVVVYGGGEAVRAIRSRTSPSVHIVEYGPRLGAVVLGPDVSDAELHGLARDVLAYEQGGCVSPRLVYALGGEGRLSDALVARLGRALEEASKQGVGPITDAEAVAIRSARARLQFGGGEGEGAIGPEDLAWTILRRAGAGAYTESLPRVLWVYRIGDVSDLRALRGVLEGRIQALAIGGVDARRIEELEDLAVELGVSRVTRLGHMAWPPADWRHDGRMQLLPLLRWTDLETGCENREGEA